MSDAAISVNLNMNLNHLPKCPKCEKGELLPVGDFMQNEKAHYYKGWVCSSCDHSIIFRMGDIYHEKVFPAEVSKRQPVSK